MHLLSVNAGSKNLKLNELQLTAMQSLIGLLSTPQNLVLIISVWCRLHWAGLASSISLAHATATGIRGATAAAGRGVWEDSMQCDNRWVGLGLKAPVKLTIIVINISSQPFSYSPQTCHGSFS